MALKGERNFRSPYSSFTFTPLLAKYTVAASITPSAIFAIVTPRTASIPDIASPPLHFVFFYALSMHLISMQHRTASVTTNPIKVHCITFHLLYPTQ